MVLDRAPPSRKRPTERPCTASSEAVVKTLSMLSGSQQRTRMGQEGRRSEPIGALGLSLKSLRDEARQDVSGQRTSSASAGTPPCPVEAGDTGIVCRIQQKG